ncbi:hypothetical protein ABZY16_39115, partial [Streptomyces sp. NPDC006553]
MTHSSAAPGEPPGSRPGGSRITPGRAGGPGAPATGSGARPGGFHTPLSGSGSGSRTGPTGPGARPGGFHTPLSGSGGSGALRRALATAMLADIDRLTDRAVDDIRAHSGTYASGAPVTREDLWEICRDNLLRALEDFGGLAATGGDFEWAARETGRRRAEQGVPLDTVLQAYRRGGRVLWQVMAEYLRIRA